MLPDPSIDLRRCLETKKSSSFSSSLHNSSLQVLLSLHVTIEDVSLLDKSTTLNKLLPYKFLNKSLRRGTLLYKKELQNTKEVLCKTGSPNRCLLF